MSMGEEEEGGRKEDSTRDASRGGSPKTFSREKSCHGGWREEEEEDKNPVRF